MFILSFFVCRHFNYNITGFCKFSHFLADSKSSAQELSNTVSFVIFGHQIWDLERFRGHPGFQVPQTG